jgi:hypothetical protein
MFVVKSKGKKGKLLAMLIKPVNDSGEKGKQQTATKKQTLHLKTRERTDRNLVIRQKEAVINY